MRLLRLALGGVVALSTLVACSSAAPPASEGAPPNLAGTSWILTSVLIDGAATRAVNQAGSLNFRDSGALAGSTGCNRFTGTWNQSGSTLTLTTGATTLIGCPPELSAQESAILDGLPRTSTFRIDGDALTLLDTDGAEIAAYIEAVTTLNGTTWQATGINNGRGGVEANAITPSVTLAFGLDGTVSGFTGCAEMSGSFSVDASKISMTELTAPPCADGDARAAQQDQYLAALQAATTFRVDGNRLELRDGDGALQVGLTSTTQ